MSSTSFVARRAALAAAAVAALGCLMPGAARAQAYPAKPIRIVVPFAPGGIADTFARVIGQRLSEAWSQPVTVENRGGAGGNIGADVVAKSAPDGYTLVMGNIGTHAVNPALFANMPFDPAKDFTPVACVMEAEGLLVVNPQQTPVASVRELVELARANAGKLTYGSGGRGTTSHLAGELFNLLGKVQLVHVPYKGNVPAITDLMGGQLNLAFATMPTVLPYVKQGRLNALAVLGTQRSPALPDVPTVAEAGLPGFEANNWIALFGPAGLPAPIAAKINAEVNALMKSAEVQKRLDAEGARFTPNTPEQCGAFVRAEATKWQKVLRDAGTRPE